MNGATIHNYFAGAECLITILVTIGVVHLPGAGSLTKGRHAQQNQHAGDDLLHFDITCTCHQ